MKPTLRLASRRLMMSGAMLASASEVRQGRFKCKLLFARVGEVFGRFLSTGKGLEIPESFQPCHNSWIILVGLSHPGERLRQGFGFIRPSKRAECEPSPVVGLGDLPVRR